MKILRFFAAVSIISIFLLPIVGRAQKMLNDLQLPYSSCTFSDGLKETNAVRLAKDADKFRELDTFAGKKKITRIDGYSVDFAYPQTDVFVNLKVEQSKAESYARDKTTVIENMRFLLSTSKEVEEKEPKKSSANGIEIYGFDRKNLGIGAVISLYVFFDSKSFQISTAYFMNQKPDKRKAQTIEEYRILRDKFINQYTKCIADHR